MFKPQYDLLTTKNQARSSRLSEGAAEVTLYERLNSVLGHRDIVLIGDWIGDARGFEPEPVYVVRASVLDRALMDEQDWGLVYERFNEAVDLVPGTVLAASARVRA